MSFCKCEAIVDSMKCITVATEQATPPPLVVMSLSVKITLNPRTGTNEVGVALRWVAVVTLNVAVVLVQLVGCQNSRSM